jgi:hypothetical protein
MLDFQSSKIAQIVQGKLGGTAQGTLRNIEKKIAHKR